MPMLNLPPQHYDQWPLSRRALAYLKGAKTITEIHNRTIDFWLVSYYLLSHSVELTIKAVVGKVQNTTPRGHNIKLLSKQYREICHFTDEEMRVIRELGDLNNGPGGLRYDNPVIGEFLPFTFRDGVLIVERLFIENFQSGD